MRKVGQPVTRGKNPDWSLLVGAGQAKSRGLSFFLICKMVFSLQALETVCGKVPSTGSGQFWALDNAQMTTEMINYVFHKLKKKFTITVQYFSKLREQVALG